MKNKKEMQIVSFICRVFLRPATIKEMIDEEHLKKCVNGICRGIEMKKLGRIQIDRLPVQMSKDIAFSLNQPLFYQPFIITRPLKTSVMFLQSAISSLTLDTWTKEKHLILVIHSCKRITKKQVRFSLKENFPGCRILGEIELFKKVVRCRI